jgi:hypothetical protein
MPLPADLPGDFPFDFTPSSLEDLEPLVGARIPGGSREVGQEVRPSR